MNPLASQPRISVIIPSRPDEDIQPTLARLRASAYPADLVEIWHATGSQPSIQRNRCAARAGGDLLYFLDNDSQIISAPNQSDTVTQLVAQCVQQPHAIVGGPSLTPASDMWFQQAVGVIFSSRFGGGAVRARYAPIGRTRSAGQHEIILCNMMMERAA
ncbi:MAG: hypothetical protein NTY53_14790 [Kiritimatiellaeota bacterium]|nr:hypothetical protein [Kiritimatiellota bacterium]